MIPISSAISGGLVWSKTPFSCSYELKSNGETVGSLRRTSFWTSEFRAESYHGSWRFRRSGCLRAGTEIIDLTSSVAIAALKPNWSGGGTLAFSADETYRITSQGFWQPVWVVVGKGDRPVLSIHSGDKTVQLTDEWYPSEARPILLAIFAWYLMKQAAEDVSGFVAAAVAATS